MSQIMWSPGSRELAWENISQSGVWDLVIAGGGITGAGIAREAARCGLNVLLVERQDFAWGTSSRSSKMVHGGLRYIAQGDVMTTLHSVRERERLMDEAPGLVDLMPYVMPHYEGRFPGPFMFGLLLRVYDLLAGHRYRRFHKTDDILSRIPFLRRKQLIGATEFADAVTDDSRLVMRVLHEARSDGAAVINYVGVCGSVVNTDGVTVALRNELTGSECEVATRCLVNATGVWVNDIRAGHGELQAVRPARGSHIVVERERLPVDMSVTVLHPRDKRPIFVYPWEGRTVIGTTDLDTPQPGNAEIGITDTELEYLLELVKYQFPGAELTARDVISSWAGIRPLVAGGKGSSSKESRDHTVWTDPRVVSVSGGKLTTFRLIARDVLNAAKPWLPDCNLDGSQRVFHVATLSENYGLPASIVRRLTGFYGAEAQEMLDSADAADLVKIPGTSVLWAELRWAAENEAVVHLDDLLLRRTRIGLLVPQGGLTHAERLRSILQPVLGWSDDHWAEEVSRYRAIWERYYWLPATTESVAVTGKQAAAEQA